MAITIRCQCGKHLKVEDELVGKRVRCPACATVLAVPLPHPVAATPAPTADVIVADIPNRLQAPSLSDLEQGNRWQDEEPKETTARSSSRRHEDENQRPQNRMSEDLAPEEIQQLQQAVVQELHDAMEAYKAEHPEVVPVLKQLDAPRPENQESEQEEENGNQAGGAKKAALVDESELRQKAKEKRKSRPVFKESVKESVVKSATNGDSAESDAENAGAKEPKESVPEVVEKARQQRRESDDLDEPPPKKKKAAETTKWQSDSRSFFSKLFGVFPWLFWFFWFCLYGYWFGNRKRQSKEYLSPGRLEDVIALIQVLGLGKAVHREEKPLQDDLKNKPGSASSWRDNIAIAHPEFFRVYPSSKGEKASDTIALIARHLVGKGTEDEPALLPEHINGLVRSAIEIHNGQLQRRHILRATWLVILFTLAPAVATVIAAMITHGRLWLEFIWGK